VEFCDPEHGAGSLQAMKRNKLTFQKKRSEMLKVDNYEGKRI
jgi:hypothetical protein